MNDSITSAAVSEIVRIAFGHFLKSGIGETGKQFTGVTLDKVNELRKKIHSWFNNKKYKKAEEAIKKIEEQGEESSLAKLVTYLTDEMEENPYLAHELQSYINEIRSLSGKNEQIIASGISASEVELDGVQQHSRGNQADNKQIIGENIQSNGKVTFRNINQEKGE
jgi:hypothetical protein